MGQTDIQIGRKVKRLCQTMPLVVVLIGQFFREVIGRQDLKVAVIGRLLLHCYFRSVRTQTKD